MKWYPSICQDEKGVELKAELQSLSFLLLSLGMSYYKEICKISWSEEDRVLKHKKKNLKRVNLALHEHIEYLFRFGGVESPDSREFWHLPLTGF